MHDILQLALDNLLSPIVLFFVLGLLAGGLKSDLAIPEVMSKGLSLYLIIAIGFRGGVELSHTGASSTIAASMVVAICFSFLLPVVGFLLLRLSTPIEEFDAAAIAAHYGSVSVVTFVAASTLLKRQGVSFEPYIVAMMALMETPGIVSGLLLARRSQMAQDGLDNGGFSKDVLREVCLSGSVVLLLGSFIIGWITGERGMDTMGTIVDRPLKGLLAIFLLDMGLLATRRVSGSQGLGGRLLAFGMYMPLIGAALSLTVARLLDFSVGGTTLVAVLAASASYIVVPTAMRVALPQANPALYVTLSLGVTFPFNLVIGIPLYQTLASLITPGS
jgi:hypothetical protein